MKRKLKTLQLRMLLPVIAMTLFIVILLTVLFSTTYISMILQQEQEVNASSFEAISRSVAPVVSASVATVRSIMMDDRVASYARFEKERRL